MTRLGHCWRAGLLAGAVLWLGCNECGCSLYTKKADVPTAHPTRTVMLDEPRVDGIAPFLTDEDGSGDGALAGLRELTITGATDELAFLIYGIGSDAGCGHDEGLLWCESVIDGTIGPVGTSMLLSADDPRVSSLTLAERQLTALTFRDGGPPQERITTATSESVAGTIRIGPRVVGGEDGIEDDGVDLDLDLTFRMSDGRDRHIVMTVSWRFVFECIR